MLKALTEYGVPNGNDMNHFNQKFRKLDDKFFHLEERLDSLVYEEDLGRVQSLQKQTSNETSTLDARYRKWDNFDADASPVGKRCKSSAAGMLHPKCFHCKRDFGTRDSIFLVCTDGTMMRSSLQSFPKNLDEKWSGFCSTCYNG